jgi:hypothetical protein
MEGRLRYNLGVGPPFLTRIIIIGRGDMMSKNYNMTEISTYEQFW